MDTLPPELLNEIIKNVSRSSLISLYYVSNLWRELSLRQIVPIKNDQQLKDASLNGDYLSILHADLSNLDSTAAIKAACEEGHWDILQLLQRGKKWYWILRKVCKGGNLNLVEKVIQKVELSLEEEPYTGWAEGFQAPDINDDEYWNYVESFIPSKAHIWNLGLQGAHKGGHDNIAELLIQKGARDS
jgi:hypothetical protein